MGFFRNGKATEYGGGRTADTIVSWLEKKTGPPALALASVEEATAFVAGKDVAVIGVFPDQTTDAAKAFLAAASSIDDIPFCHHLQCRGCCRAQDRGRGCASAEDLRRWPRCLGRGHHRGRCCRLHRWRVAAPCGRLQPGDRPEDLLWRHQVSPPRLPQCQGRLSR